MKERGDEDLKRAYDYWSDKDNWRAEPTREKQRLCGYIFEFLKKGWEVKDYLLKYVKNHCNLSETKKNKLEKILKAKPKAKEEPVNLKVEPVNLKKEHNKVMVEHKERQNRRAQRLKEREQLLNKPEPKAEPEPEIDFIEEMAINAKIDRMTFEELKEALIKVPSNPKIPNNIKNFIVNLIKTKIKERENEKERQNRRAQRLKERQNRRAQPKTKAKEEPQYLSKEGEEDLYNRNKSQNFSIKELQTRIKKFKSLLIKTPNEPAMNSLVKVFERLLKEKKAEPEKTPIQRAMKAMEDNISNKSIEEKRQELLQEIANLSDSQLPTDGKSKLKRWLKFSTLKEMEEAIKNIPNTTANKIFIKYIDKVVALKKELIEYSKKITERRDKVVGHLKKEEDRYAIFDNGKKNKLNDKKINISFDDVEFKNVSVYNNPNTMDKNEGVGWRLKYGYSNFDDDGYWDEEETYKNPLNNSKVDEGLRDHSLFKNKHFITAHINQQPHHIAHIESYGDGPTSNPLKVLHINFVDVHPYFQRKGYADNTFYLLWAYLKHMDYFKDINVIELQYAASHFGALKVYNRYMMKAGYVNDELKNIDWNNENEAKNIHDEMYGSSIVWKKKRIGAALKRKIGGMTPIDMNGRVVSYTGF